MEVLKYIEVVVMSSNSRNTKSFTRSFSFLVLFSALLLSSNANALLTLTLSGGGSDTDLVITDDTYSLTELYGDAAHSTSGTLVFFDLLNANTFGDYTISATGNSEISEGNPSGLFVHLIVASSGPVSADPLTITLTETGYTQTYKDAKANTSVSFDKQAAWSTTQFTSTLDGTTLASLDGAGYVQNTGVSTSNPFILELVSEITHAGAGISDFHFAVAIPAPATLTLLGLGLLALAYASRKRFN